MLEPKLKYNKTETKTAMVLKMVKFIKTCDQYPYMFIFCHFFSSIILPLSLEEKYKKRCLVEMVNFLLLKQEVMIRTRGRFLLRYSTFWLTHAFFSNLNNMNLKICRYHGAKYRFEKIQKTFWREYKPFRKESIEIWEGVSLKSILKDWGGNRQYVCLPFCWTWLEGWDISCKFLKKVSYKFQENVCFLRGFWSL